MNSMQRIEKIKKLKIKVNSPYLEEILDKLLEFYKVTNVNELSDDELKEVDSDIDFVIKGGILFN